LPHAKDYIAFDEFREQGH